MTVNLEMYFLEIVRGAIKYSFDQNIDWPNQGFAVLSVLSIIGKKSRTRLPSVQISVLRNTEAFGKLQKRTLFCSRTCKDKAQEIGGIIQQAHVSNGLRSYRNRALKIHGPTCAHCGYSQDPKMLDVDHVNGREDHSIRSLQVLCVWCHALKSRDVKIHSWIGKL